MLIQHKAGRESGRSGRVLGLVEGKYPTLGEVALSGVV